MPGARLSYSHFDTLETAARRDRHPGEPVRKPSKRGGLDRERAARRRGEGASARRFRVTVGTTMLLRSFLPAVLLLAGCSGVPTLPALTPHRMDIQQGNVVTQEMVSKLKPGMTRSQVRFVLGTPLVVDPFRTNRWDYVYWYEKGGQVREQRRIAVIFEGDKLVRIEGDVVPAPRASGEGAGRTQPAPAPARAPAETAREPQPEPAGARLVTGSGEPVAGAVAQQERAQEPPQPAQRSEPAGERGFFGRVLERLGF
jgi:outer membrane protein assembly factor BamE